MKTFEVAVVHGHRQCDDEGALRLLKETTHTRVEVDGCRGPVELREGGLEELVPGFAAVGIFRTVTRAAD